MKERFKYRFWCEKDKTMYYVNSNNCIFTKQRRLNLSSVFNNESDRYIPLQCTGLKDKNGKLIYEGDILKFYAQSIIDAMAREPLKERIGVAVWNEEELKFDVSVDNGKNVVPNLCKKTDDNNFEIIGNIYENKELLREKK